MLTFLKSIQHLAFYDASILATLLLKRRLTYYPNYVIIYGNKPRDPFNLIKSHLILDCSEHIKQLLIDW